MQRKISKEEHAMLESLGMKDIEELFLDIPKEIRHELTIQNGKDEFELRKELKQALSKNKNTEDISVFLGGGIYNHFVPAAVDSIVSRSEFYTSYTPYQSEVSQGMLQALFEYQSFISELTGMDAANTSMYDGATALSEACLMAVRINKNKEIIIPKALDPIKKSVLNNYCKGPNIKLKEVGFDTATGKINTSELSSLLTKGTSAVYIESPNFFGVIEDELDEVRKITEDKVLIVGANPLSLAILKPPGDFQADIVVGEGQPLGLNMNYGGPMLGVFACRKEYIRKMPGRVVGLTEDKNGQQAFCIALQVREQHIRRDKATSNICTNESLCALASGVYMALLGSKGLRRLALKNMKLAKELMERINDVDGFEAPQFKGHHFNEFVALSEMDWVETNAQLLKQNIQGGLVLKEHFPGFGNSCLIAVTETTSSEEIDRFVNTLEATK